MNAKVTVVIPTYNHARFVQQALESLIKQTFLNWEAIVVNNYSQDNTIEVVEGFGDSRIRLVNFHNNGIVAASRNEGIRHADGDFIAFLDSDDVWHPKKLAEQVQVMERFPTLGLVYSIMETFGELEMASANIKRLLPLPNKAGTSRAELERANTIPCSSVIVRRKLFDEFGLLDENPEVSWCNDYDMWIRISSSYPIGFIPRIQGYYRLHTSQLSKDVARMNREIAYIRQKHGIVAAMKVDQKREGFLKVVLNIYHFVLILQQRITDGVARGLGVQVHAKRSLQ